MMKKYLMAGWGAVALVWPLAAAALLLAVCFLGSGCESLTNAVVTPRSNVVTNLVTLTEFKTNFVPVLVQVPVPGSNTVTVITNLVERVVTNETTRIVVETNTVYVARQSITTGLEVAQVAAPFAGPFAPAATAGLTALSGVLAWLVKRKNDEANGVRDENESLTGQITAVVRGVESVSKALPDGQADKVKETIAAISKQLGVSDDLHATVQAVTQS